MTPRYRDYRKQRIESPGRVAQWCASGAASVVLGFFHGLRLLKWLLAALFLFTFASIKTLGVWTVHYIALPLYQAVRRVRKIIIEHGGQHILLHVISHAWFLRVAGAIVISGIVGWNMGDRLVRADAYGDTMPIGALVYSEEDALIEENAALLGPTSVGSNGNNFGLTLQAPLELPGGTDNLAGELSVPTTSGTTALVKPEGIQSSAPSIRTEPIMHIVQAGDTLSTIAEQYGLSVNTILWANNLTARSLLRLGQKIKILPTTGVSHVVKRGETIASIAAKYKVTVEKIREFNNFESNKALAVGQEIVVPDGRPIALLAPPKTPTTVIKPSLSPMITKGVGLLWPLGSHHITQYYNFRHHAIDIGTPVGSPVYAVQDGVVEVAHPSGWNTGYGKMIILNHGNGMKTLYGHNSQLFITVGERVSKGQVISASGNTGRSTGPHLHFEVIINGVRQNPLGYVRY